MEKKKQKTAQTQVLLSRIAKNYTQEEHYSYIPYSYTKNLYKIYIKRVRKT